LLRLPNRSLRGRLLLAVLGGHATYPYWNRNYTAGLEPTSAYPAADVPVAQRRNGTLKQLAPGERHTASYEASVGRP